MTTLHKGDAAPEFELMNQDQQTVKLSELRGKTVVLLFYPMDFSSVCSAEHCEIGPAIVSINPDGNTVVFGVNADHPFCHAAFKKQLNIPYDLLSDPTRQMLKAYGMFSGETPFNCSKRGTVVIAPDGRVKAVQEVEILHERDISEIAALLK